MKLASIGFVLLVTMHTPLAAQGHEALIAGAVLVAPEQSRDPGGQYYSMLGNRRDPFERGAVTAPCMLIYAVGYIGGPS